MRICVPTITNEGLEAKINVHFGSSPFFSIYDTDQGTLEVVDNGNQHHMHGMCQPMSVLEDHRVDIIVCSGIGSRAIQRLNNSGIEAYLADGETVSELLERYKAGALKRMTPDQACPGHGCH